MDRSPIRSPAPLRFGLGRQAAVVAGFFVVLLAAATLLAHLLQWQSTVILRRIADRDLPRTVAACRILEHAAQCSRLQDRLEATAGQAESCRKTLEAWRSQHANLADQVELLAADDSAKQQEATVAERKSALEKYRREFLDVAAQIEAGRLTSRTALRDALRPTHAVLQTIMDDAESLVSANQAAARVSREELQRAADSRTRLINVRSVVAVMVVIVTVVWFRRVVLARLRDISDMVSRLAAGDLSARLECRSADELGLLTAQCNEMAAAMQASQHALQRTKAAAQAADLAKNVFIANITQEMGVALSVVSVQADMLLAAPETSHLLEAAGTIKHNSESLLEVVHNVSELVKIASGELLAVPRACSPSQVMAEAAKVWRPRAEAKGLQLLMDCDGLIPETVETDPARLRQILFSLIGYTIKCNEQGDIRLTARYLERAGGGPRLQLEVLHAGVNMTQRQIDQLSAPIASESFAEQMVTASALGLVVCRRVVDMLSGTIHVDNVPGAGTMIVVTIPAPSLDAPPLATPSASEPLPARPVPAETPVKAQGSPRFRILLAEDGPENRRLMSVILRKAGAEVSMAENGQEAVQMAIAAAAEPFELVLMDMQMPVMDGYEATRQLRQSGYAGLIVAVTGHTQSYDREKCLDAGCNDYLAKPVDREKLLSLVSEHVACRSRHVHAGT